MKKLCLSRDNKMFAGVCGGIADYLKVDPTLIRIIWVLCTFAFVLTPIILYVILWALMPLQDSQ